MELAVIIIGTDQEQRAVLQMQVDSTAVAKVTQSFSALPVAATDPIFRRVRDAAPDVVIVDLPRQSPLEGVRIIELLRAEAPNAALFAFGETSQPNVIIATMRAGAREFLERPTNTGVLLEAFVRVTAAQRKKQPGGQRGKIFTFLNTKGGAGATTIAVNTAIELQKLGTKTVLVDLAPLAHTSLHLNVRPTFSVLDVFRNLQRLDHALLESYLTDSTGGLQLLAGSNLPAPEELVTSDFARLFDMLVAQYRYIVVDASSRLDRFVKLVCDLSDTVLLVSQPDVTSLWSAAKIQDFLGDGADSNRLRLVMNRYRKIPGLSDADIQRTTRIKTVYRLPNQYNAVASSIERGMPVVQENHSEIARAFVSLATALAERPAKQQPVRKSFSLFGA